MTQDGQQTRVFACPAWCFMALQPLCVCVYKRTDEKEEGVSASEGHHAPLPWNPWPILPGAEEDAQGTRSYPFSPPPTHSPPPRSRGSGERS